MTAPAEDRPTVNDRLAAWGTKGFNSMWCVYAFGIYGALGAVFPRQQQPLLYWSNWIQLVALPLIMVGTAVLTRAAARIAEARAERAEQRAEETHAAVMEELALARETAQTQAAILEDTQAELALLREFVQKGA